MEYLPKTVIFSFPDENGLFYNASRAITKA
jgi:hypothetical protein